MAGRRLRSVAADRPRRVLGIVRVSKERDGMVSPELQEHKIRAHCEAAGHLLVPAPDGREFLYGLDESGSQAKSSWWQKLDAAVALVEAGEVDGIVVWKFSRIARNRLRWNVALDRVESVGGVLESATEDFDTTTAAGRLGRGISAEFNAFQADMIGEGWTEAHERRVREGRPHSGKPKWGYVYDPARRLHVPDPGQGPVLASVYARYVAGESVYALTRWLNDHGWRTLAGGPWSGRTLRRVLDSGFAAGLFSYRGRLHQGVHEPLIDAELWQAYLDARSARRNLPARTERSTYLLSGLVRCARCGGAMVANRVDPGTRLSRRGKGRAEGKRYSNGRPRMTFRCDRGKETRRCRGGSIAMGLVEEFVMAHLEGLAAGVDAETAVLEASGRVVDARRELLVREEERLVAERDRKEAALVRLALRDAEAPMPREVFEAARGELEGAVARLGEAIEAAGRTYRRAAADPARRAAGLLDEWVELPVAARRELLRSLIDCVLVRVGDGCVGVVSWEEVRG